MKAAIKKWFDKNYSVCLDIESRDHLISIINDCVSDMGPKWIAVGDELPHPDRCVDLWCRLIGGYSQGDESRVENVFYNPDLCYWWYLDDNSDHTILKGVEITHWMPLPKAPE